MTDPFNQVPTDPAWEALADRLAEDAAKQLGGMVLFVVMQPAGGKIGVTLAGVPESGPMAEMAKNVPETLAMLSGIIHAMDLANKGATRQ